MGSALDALKELDAKLAMLHAERLALFKRLGIRTKDPALPFRDLREEPPKEQDMFREWARGFQGRAIELEDGVLLVYGRHSTKPVWAVVVTKPPPEDATP